MQTGLAAIEHEIYRTLVGLTFKKTDLSEPISIKVQGSMGLAYNVE
jgi:hypothetical protein